MTQVVTMKAGDLREGHRVFLQKSLRVLEVTYVAPSIIDDDNVTFHYLELAAQLNSSLDVPKSQDVKVLDPR